MAYQTLVPNSVISNDLPSSGWPSGLTIDQVLSDGSLLTALRHVHSAPGDLTRVGFTTYTLQANERVAGLRMAMQMGQTQPVLFLIMLKNAAAMGLAVWSPVAFPTGSRLPIFSPWFSKDSTDGLEWTQADLDGLEAYIDWRNPGGTFDGRLYDLTVYVDVKPQPTALNIYPAASDVIDTDRPRFIWRVQQEGDVTQNRYTLKVFTKAIVEGVGFDPATSTAVGTIGPKVTSSTRADWLSPLPALVFGDDYYWTVKTEVKFLGGLWASEWSQPTPFSLNDPPTVDVLTPTGVVSATNTPLITWDFIDPELNPQSEALARIFAQPGGTWVGFDPDTATPLFEATVIGETEQIQSTTRLANAGTFRTYMKAAHRLSDGKTLWGPWAFEDFTTSYAAPAAPTLSVAPHNDRVMLTLTPPGGPWTPDIDSFMIERSLDGGLTWSTFRYGSLLKSTGFPDLTTPQVIYDFEVPYFTTVQYRAFSVSTDLGLEVLSVASATASTSISQPSVWVKDPSDFTLGDTFPTEEGWIPGTISRERNFHQALGRSLPIATRGTAAGVAFSLTFMVLGETKFDRLDTLLKSNRTLFIQTPKGSWYMEVATDYNSQDRLGDRRQGEQDIRKITVPLREVDFA